MLQYLALGFNMRQLAADPAKIAVAVLEDQQFFNCIEHAVKMSDPESIWPGAASQSAPCTVFATFAEAAACISAPGQRSSRSVKLLRDAVATQNAAGRLAFKFAGAGSTTAMEGIAGHEESIR